MIYPVAATGRSGYADSAEIGPILLAQYGRFTLRVGSGGQLPDFRVKITCRAAEGPPWQIAETLLTPRGPAQLRTEHELRRREAEERQALAQARGVSYQLRGGGGIGTGPRWQMTTLRVVVRNDSDLLASDVRLVIGDDDFVWGPELGKPVPPKQQVDVQTDLNGALPNAPRSEASGKPFHSYPSRLEFVLGGRRFTRRGDADPSSRRRLPPRTG